MTSSRDAPFAQGDIGAQSDTPDSDNPVRDVDDVVSRDDSAPVWCKGFEILVQTLQEEVGVLRRESCCERRVLDQLTPSVILDGEPRHRMVTRTPPGALRGAPDLGQQPRIGDVVGESVEIDPVEGAIEQWTLGQLRQVEAIRGHTRGCCCFALSFGETVLPTGPPRCSQPAFVDPIPRGRDVLRRNR